MVRYNPKVWFSILFHNYSRQVVRTLTPALLFLTVFTAVACFVLLYVFELHLQEFRSEIVIHQLLGIVLGLFLVFRVNTAYDRWWEGRKLWGSMVNNTRNIALKLSAYLPETDRETREWFARMVSNIPHALKDHLRGRLKIREIDFTEPAMEAEVESAAHIPNYISARLYSKVEELRRSGVFSSDQVWLLDRELKEFSDIIGACERIRNTPIPYSFSMFIKKFIFLYLITLPFGLMTTLTYLTIPVVFLVSYILLSVELIAEEIEDPFGKDQNDLPTDSISHKIRDNIREILRLPASPSGQESPRIIK